MINKNKVEKTLYWESTTIRLYDVGDSNSLPITSLGNIEAFDSKGNLIWIADPPETKRDYYWNMKIDTANKILLAYSGLSFLAEISLETGKILKFYMIK